MKKLFVILPFSLFALSCEKEVALEHDEIQPRIVVNGIFVAGDTVEVHISESRDVLYDGVLPDLSNASARLYDGNDNFLGDFTSYGNGTYRLENYIPVSNMTYKIKVTNPGFDDVSAQTVTPAPITITSIDTLRKGDFMTYEIKFNDVDPSATNYYAVTLEANIVYEDEITGEIYYYSEPGFYTSELYTQNGTEDVDGTKWGTIFLFSDATFNGGTCSFSAENFVSQYDSVIVVAGVRSLSEDYFKYSISLDKYQQNEGDPFSQPVQVYTNIENGFGIFGGYSVSRDTIVIQ